MVYNVRVTGKMLTGVPEAELSAAASLAQEWIGTQLLSEWHDRLNKAIKHPTPYYETQIQVARRGPDVVVNDRQIVYGPWLEGVGTRNETTSFKGYGALRRARGVINARIPKVVAPIINAFTSRMNG